MALVLLNSGEKKAFSIGIGFFLIIVLSLCFIPPASVAASMSDYCITPPYIGSSIQPNLMLMMDNSGSMYDLAYTDPANYCYDETYQSTQTYPGYFKSNTLYSLTSDGSGHYFFVETGSFPSSCPAGNDSEEITSPSNQLFVCYDASFSATDPTARSVTTFVALGNYLNWLTMSKFDIEKQILTGGKYVAGYLTAESRGCVGQTFIKQPLTADYVAGGTNTPLGITFGITGPPEQNNPSAPSPGGTTQIHVYVGSYNQAACQAAINDFSSTSTATKQQMENDIGNCIGYTSSSGKTCAVNGASCQVDSDCYAKNSDGTLVTGACGSGGGACGTLNNTAGATCSTSNPGGISGICQQQSGSCSSGQTCVGGTNAGATCTRNSDCTSNNCSKTCTNSMMLGVACNNNNACNASKCTQGNTMLASCSQNSDCDLMTCGGTGTSLNGQTCSSVNNCKYGTCTSGKSSSTHCVSDVDCSTAVCTSGSADKINRSCTTNTDCVDYYGPCQQVAQLGSTYSQTMLTCYQLLFKNQTLTQGDYSYVDGNNACNTFYKNTYTCLTGPRDGLPCTGPTDTSCGTGTCSNGPGAIRPGSPVLVCSQDYAGYCASTTSAWNSTTWGTQQYAAVDGCACDKNGNNCNCCVGQAIVAYCNAAQVSNVTDPTSNTSATASTGNLPAILSGTSIQGQLGSPLGPNVPVLVAQSSPPTGLIQQYGSQIRMGAMTFNLYGTPAECSTAYPPAANTVPCPMICSTDPTVPCGSKLDCPLPSSAKCLTVADYLSQGFPSSCYYAGTNLPVQPFPKSCSSDSDCGLAQTCLPANKDAAEVISYIGFGTCYNSSTKTQISPVVNCATDAGCATSQYCQPNGVGDHTSGLVNSIDNIVAATWTPFAEGFYDAIGYFAKNPSDSTGKSSRSDIRINGADYDISYNPDQVVCQSNNLLLITDGMSTADRNTQMEALPTLYSSGSTLYGGTGLCPDYSGSTFLENLSWIAYNRDITTLTLSSPASTTVPTNSSSRVKTYVVYNSNDTTSTVTGDCNSQTLLTNTAANGGTQLLLAKKQSDLTSALQNAFDQVAAKAASGTAASVLASSQGSGANLMQAVFYPHRNFSDHYCSNNFSLSCTQATQATDCGTGTCIDGNDEIQWIGRLSNLWYYVDPYSTTSSIMEDNGITTAGPNYNPMGGNKILDLNAPDLNVSGDYIVHMYFDKTYNVTRANRWTDNGTGLISQQTYSINFEDLGAIWEAGLLLWSRDITASPRTIYTTTGGSLIPFTTANAGTLSPYIQPTAGTASDIISWVTGSDVPGYRKRTVKVETYDTTPRVWKLGDVINSTPTIMSWKELNYYYTRYGDGTYGMAGDPNAPPDSSMYTTTAAYKKRGMVFAGGNDGMLHAFKLGTLQEQWGQSATQKARLVDPDTGELCSSDMSNPTCGQELWAFIPKNALPYLKYMADPGYQHVYSIDLTPYLFDASIGGSSDTATTAKTVNSWRTILVGGMRLGGASVYSSSTCTNCVQTPGSDPADSTKGLGYSSYFALDITDPKNPKFLWEFNDPSLGFSTSGPSVVRIGDPAKNGNWFVVLASGPTGPISTSDHQFLARSDQNLKIFILDLKTGALLRTVDTGIANAFAGSLASGALDLDNDYQDELVYVPYVTPLTDASNNTTWTSGGVGRLTTKRSSNPADWVWNQLIDGVGPVTAAVGKLEDTTADNLWVFFGTGRYYFVQQKVNGSDDPTNQRYIFGIKDPCESAIRNNIACTYGDPAVTFSSLTDVTDVSNVPTASTADGSTFKGWYIGLDPAGSYTYAPDPAANFLAERIVTDPLAGTSGLVFFTSYKPFTDLCLLSGDSFIWAVQYNTGGPPIGLTGMALVQTSTGAIQQINLSSAFTSGGGRKAMIGLGQPPIDQGLTVQTPPPPVKRVVHIKER